MGLDNRAGRHDVPAPWAGNLLYFPALLLWGIGPRTRPWGALLASGALALAALTFRIHSVIVNEAGHRAAVRPGLGAWLWMTSMMVLVLGALIRDHSRRVPTSSRQPPSPGADKSDEGRDRNADQ